MAEATSTTPIRNKKNNAIIDTPQKPSQDILEKDGNHHNAKKKTTLLPPLPSCDPDTDLNPFRTAVTGANGINSKKKTTSPTPTATAAPAVPGNSPIEGTPTTATVSQTPVVPPKPPRKSKPATDVAHDEVAPPDNKRRKKDQIPEQQNILSDEAPPLPTVTPVAATPVIPAPVPEMTSAPAPVPVPEMTSAPAPVPVPEMTSASAPAPAPVPVMTSVPVPAPDGQPGRVFAMNQDNQDNRWIHCVLRSEETEMKVMFFPPDMNMNITVDSHYAFQYRFDNAMRRYVITAEPILIQLNTPIEHIDLTRVHTATGKLRNVSGMIYHHTSDETIRYFKFNLKDYWCSVWENVFMTQLTSYNLNQQNIFATLQHALMFAPQNDITIHGTVSEKNNKWFKVQKIDNLKTILTNYIDSKKL
jgi:hypothetical protein